jgi:glycosyltransferase involved in cell wall biosynthesis
MKIGIDCHHFKDQKGIERYLFNLLTFWKKEKKINFILYFQKGDQSVKRIPQSDNFFIRELKNPFNISSTALFQHFTLPRAAQQDHLDIFFSPSYLLPFFYIGKTALTIHDIIYEAHPAWFNFRSFRDKILIKKMGKISAQKTDLILVPSQFTKKEIQKFYNIDASKIKVVPLAADKIFLNAQKKKILYKKYNLKEKFFIFSAALFQRRCLHESIFAFKEIAQEFSDYQYLIIGKDFTNLGNVRQLTNNLNKQLKRDAFIYIDHFIDVKELASLYKTAHAVIYLSLYEGFGLPVIEAMASATPVICGNAQALAEIVQSHCFWVKNPKNIKQISRMMQQSIQKSAKYKKNQKEGFLKAQEFSWRLTAQKTLTLIKECLK